MNKLFVQLCVILSLLLMRKVFQTGSPLLPLPLELQNPQPNMCNHHFWMMQPTCFMYPEAKPCVSCREVVSGIASEERHMKFSWLLSQQEFFVLGGKK